MSRNVPSPKRLRPKHFWLATSRDPQSATPTINGSYGGSGRHTAVAIAAPDRPDPRLITVEEVAQIVGLSVRQIWRLVSAGEFLQPIKLGRATRWNRQKLIDWINAGCPELNA